ncbi:restriction endonuclease subunit S [Algoriphagus sediminis]|uniref:Restriction endonuclease subunit S n=1 Tax=Algoriphagus sediminis TaxID=3057113 RepID=A0ABT7YIG1_9BACT|nr:restriction endonuclease subunit S [Algoriphagus sediminis]MDN3205934.1 restriction endonuclease subunit S [Algoriphagus sediminis]
MKLLDLFQELTIHPKNAKEIKGLILQLAIKGMLTKNWRHKKQVTKSKEEFLKIILSGKTEVLEYSGVKKEKPINPFSKEDESFEVPDTWVWCRFATAAYIVRGGSPRPIKSYITDDPNGLNWIKIGDTKGATKYIESCAEKIIPEGLKKSRYVEPGDFLLSNSMSFGKPYIMKTDGCIHDGWLLIREVKKALDKDYLFYLLSSPYIYSSFKDSAAGGVVQNLNIEKVRQTMLPIPPLEEQKAIVAIVEQLFKEFEALEEQTKVRVQLKEDFVTSALAQLTTENTSQIWSFLQPHFNEFFTEKSGVKKLRESILQLAVQGKLTKHWRAANPNVEPASTLLAKIKAEKEALIKAKKIKKEKPLPEITEEEIPYELPEGWEWVRLGEAFTYGTRDKAESNSVHQDTWVLELEDVEKSSSKLLQKVRFKDRQFRSTKSIFRKGDVIYGKLRPYLDKVIVADEQGVCTTEMIPIKIYSQCSPEYLRLYLKNPSFIEYANSSTHGMNLPRMGTDKAVKAIIALPPTEEQKAIVQTVNTLMSLCDQLDQAIEEGEVQIQQLMQSCSREVFEG